MMKTNDPLINAVSRVLLTESVRQLIITSRAEAKRTKFSWLHPQEVKIEVEYSGYSSLEARDEKSLFKGLKEATAENSTPGKKMTIKRLAFSKFVVIADFTGKGVHDFFNEVDVTTLDPDNQGNEWEWEFKVNTN